MVRCADGMEFDAKVPGTVLSVLLDNKAIEDPFYRRNEYVTRELFRDDYEFCREFEVSDSFLKEEHTELVCEGLDTLAEIYINGERLAQTDNMHRIWRTSLAGVLRAGRNTVRIVFRSPLKYIEEYQYSENREVQYVPCGCMKGALRMHEGKPDSEKGTFHVRLGLGPAAHRCGNLPGYLSGGVERRAHRRCPDLSAP